MTPLLLLFQMNGGNVNVGSGAAAGTAVQIGHF